MLREFKKIKKRYIFYFLFFTIFYIYAPDSFYRLRNVSRFYGRAPGIFYDYNRLRTSQWIDKKILDQKIKVGLPKWALAQIHEDLSHYKNIKKSDLDFYKKNNRLCKFSIKNKKMDFICGDPSAQNEDLIRFYIRYMTDVFSWLSRESYLPDTEFVLNTIDHFNLPEKPKIPIFVFAKDLDEPLEKDLVLIPDWMNLMEASQLRPQIREASRKWPWSAKENKFFFRTRILTFPRQAVVTWGQENPELIDAKFLGPSVPYVKIPDHLHYKYLLSIDGIRASWTRLVWHLHSNSLTFKYQSNQVQWFYKGIKPYKHYIPFGNQDSLLAGYEWAQTHPQEVQKIIQRSTEFVENNLSIEDMYHYLIVLVQEYTKKLQ